MIFLFSFCRSDILSSWSSAANCHSGRERIKSLTVQKQSHSRTALRICIQKTVYALLFACATKFIEWFKQNQQLHLWVWSNWAASFLLAGGEGRGMETPKAILLSFRVPLSPATVVRLTIMMTITEIFSVYIWDNFLLEWRWVGNTSISDNDLVIHCVRKIYRRFHLVKDDLLGNSFPTRLCSITTLLMFREWCRYYHCRSMKSGLGWIP